METGQAKEQQPGQFKIVGQVHVNHNDADASLLGIRKTDEFGGVVITKYSNGKDIVHIESYPAKEGQPWEVRHNTLEKHFAEIKAQQAAFEKLSPETQANLRKDSSSGLSLSTYLSKYSTYLTEVELQRQFDILEQARKRGQSA